MRYRITGPEKRSAPAVIVLLLVILLEHGLYAEAVRDRTPLHWAAVRGRIEIVNLLLEQGVEVNATDLAGRTPLHLAGQYPEIIQALLAAGAQVDSRDFVFATPLHRAVRFEQAVTVLLEAGADPNARDAAGRTPLDLALGRGDSRDNLRIITTLILAGAE